MDFSLGRRWGNQRAISAECVLLTTFFKFEIALRLMSLITVEMRISSRSREVIIYLTDLNLS